jgi:adenylate kinase family enzyme
MQECGQRISVVGTTGSGKTTVAQEISKRLQVPHIELDALFWDENWTEVPDEVFRDRVASATENERWVIDGNYSRVRNLVWARANTVVYLDYSFWRVFWQLMRRTIRRSLRKEELWNGNREEFGKSFFSRDSILWWMLRTYHRRRKQYSELFQQSAYAHLGVVHLRTPQMTKEWLSGIIDN